MSELRAIFPSMGQAQSAMRALSDLGVPTQDLHGVDDGVLVVFVVPSYGTSQQREVDPLLWDRTIQVVQENGGTVAKGPDQPREHLWAKPQTVGEYMDAYAKRYG